MAYSVKKVDINGNIIKAFSTWKKKNKTALYFDSKLEYEIWNHLKLAGYDIEVEPKIHLADAVTTVEYVLGKAKKSSSKTYGKGELKDIKQPAIGFKPDFYLKDKDIYIEAKGFSGDTEAFRLRWKLFKVLGFTGYIVYNIADLKSILKLI